LAAVLLLAGCGTGGAAQPRPSGTEGDVNAVEPVTDRTPEEVGAELRRRMDADADRYADGAAVDRDPNVLYLGCGPLTDTGLPTDYYPSYTLGWELAPEDVERLVAEVRAAWEARGEVTDVEPGKAGQREFTVVEPDGYDATFIVTPPEGEEVTALAGMVGTGPCAVQPGGATAPPGGPPNFEVPTFESDGPAPTAPPGPTPGPSGTPGPPPPPAP